MPDIDLEISNLLKPLQESTTALPLALFDPAADILLHPLATWKAEDERDDVERYFHEYFSFLRNGPHGANDLSAEDRRRTLLFRDAPCARHKYEVWPIPDTCVRAEGVRGNWNATFQRLHFGDIVWLYYIERMGIFSILGAILDDFAATGRYPIPADSLQGAVLETMVREMRAGVGSTSRERQILFKRTLGWTLPNGGGVSLDGVTPNASFDSLFHRFISAALELYLQERLSEVIGGNVLKHRASMATLISVRDTMRLLKRALEPMTYGRMYTTTLNGIVWAIAGFAVLRDVRNDLGIPQSYRTAEDYVPAAYDKLVARDEGGSSQRDRFRLHHDCATNARDLLLDIEVFPKADMDDPSETGRLATWLKTIEDTVESYRTAYRALTGIDLGPAAQAREGARTLQPV